jgi:hypothetical protein
LARGALLAIFSNRESLQSQNGLNLGVLATRLRLRALSVLDQGENLFLRFEPGGVLIKQ